MHKWGENAQFIFSHIPSNLFGSFEEEWSPAPGCRNAKS